MVSEKVIWLDDYPPEGTPGELSILGGLLDNGFPAKMFWREYLERVWPEDLWPKLEVLRKELLKVKLTGEMHNNGKTPILSDGTYFGFSMRALGDILAAIHNTRVGEKRYGYMDFYYWLWPDDVPERPTP